MKKKLLCSSGSSKVGLGKLLNIPRFGLLLLFVSMIHFNTYANGLFDTGQLSLNADHLSIKQVLQSIENQSNYYFMYNDNEINLNRKVSINLKNKDISELLNVVFSGTSTKYTIKDRQIVLYPKTTNPSVTQTNQKKLTEVKGKVTNVAGDPLPGVTISIKGTNHGAITDANGNYTIISKEINSKSVLVFSFVGMKKREMKITSSKIDVVMEENNIDLDEVVAIGYGTMKKRDLTGSVASVQGKELTKIPITNTAEALTGRLAGVQVTTADGSPDADIVIRVHGGGSVTGENSPLYIVDGFPVSSINDISPTDIETIDVLKDASSTAIYGAQGANGVILITTKSPKAGKTTISYNTFFQTKKLKKKLKVLDTYEYVMLNYELAALGGDDDLESFEEKFGVYDDLDLYKYEKGTDWQDEMFGSNVLSQQQNISINGGTQRTKFLFSGTYDKNGGLMENNDYTRYNFNFKVNHEISEKLLFKLNARVADVVINGSGTSGSTYKVRTTDAIKKGPTNGLDDYTTVDPTTLDDDEYEEWVEENLTLSEQAAQYWKRKYRKTYNFTGSIEWKIAKNLTYRLDGGYQIRFYDTQNYWGEYTSTASYVDGLPLVDWKKQEYKKFREAQTLTYKFNINKDHHFNFLLGHELTTSNSGYTYIYATSYSTDLDPETIFANLSLTEGDISVSSYESADDNLVSFFSRLGYNYKDKYLVTFTLRADGSSKFPEKNHWGYFPAGALGWRIIEEPFMASTKGWLSNLKLRVSYGEVGNNNIASTLFKTTYSLGTSKAYGVDDELSSYYSTSSDQLTNPDLKWETTITRNIGLDFGFFDERLSGSLEFYRNSANDLLIEHDIVAPGYETEMENAGETSNKGIDFSMNALIVNKHNFTLSGNLNININRSIVDKLADGIDEQSYASGWAGTDNKGYYDYKVKVGKPVGLMYGWKCDGYYTTDDFDSYDASSEEYVLKDGEPTNGLLGGTIGVRPGTIKLEDLDGDGDITTDDRTIIGDANPKFTGGFGLNATSHGFDISLMFSFVYGNDIYNADKIASTQQYRTNYTNMLDIMDVSNRYTYLDRSTGKLVTDLDELKEMNETGSNKKKLWSPFSFGNAVVMPTDWAIEDGSYLRLQTVTLGYTLPTKLTRKFYCSQLRFYCTINNLWLLTNYSGYDPEVYSPVRSSSTSNLTPGVDYSSYPKSLAWTFGLNVKF